MMDHMSFISKSPEKSSPSLPDDCEEDEDDSVDIRSMKFTPCKVPHGMQEDEHEHPPDVTMLAEDDDDDGQIQPFSLNVDSPRHHTDSSEKKVHWSNQNVQTLLDCVERHLDEFNIQKKHKQVWQTIGAEMETFGFTMEHCYNKWKNLRRDVRLLVNNPQKAVRNADILRRVARLILVIYPNIDANTMQVSGDRNGKSAPATPVGVHNLGGSKLNVPSALHAPDSPRFAQTGSSTPRCITPGLHTGTPCSRKHKNDKDLLDPSVPGTVLFTNLAVDTESPEYTVETKQNDVPTTSFPFIFNPAAAALLVQSQLFNDLLRQQQRTQGDDSVQRENAQRDQPKPASSTPKFNVLSHSHSPAPPTGLTNGNGIHSSSTVRSVSLASTLLNGLTGTDNCNYLVASTNPHGIHDMQTQINRLPPGSELAGVVERLRDEETVHLRLTDMMTHIADELRAAGMRRRAALDQLLGIMQGARIPTTLLHKSMPADSNSRI
ncbi:unnamed protein product [Dicrocoelium dendriticum]|nr:unnamed protein product [Dicrocoelium dendriticum]